MIREDYSKNRERDFKITNMYEVYHFKDAVFSRVSYIDKNIYMYNIKGEIKNKINSFLNLFYNFLNSNPPYHDVKPVFKNKLNQNTDNFYNHINKIKEGLTQEYDRLTKKIELVNKMTIEEALEEHKKLKSLHRKLKLVKVSQKNHKYKTGVDYKSLSLEEKKKYSAYRSNREKEFKNTFNILLEDKPVNIDFECIYSFFNKID